MAVTTGFLINGVDIGTYFGAKGASTANPTGFLVNGVDLNQLLLARQDGQALGFATGYISNGSDLNAYFGVPNGNTPLPINGQSYSAFASSGTVSSVANLVFGTSNVGWSVTRTQNPGSSGTLASGSLPSGAVAVAFNLTVTSSTTNTSSSNAAPSQTTLTGTLLSASIQANGSPSQPERDITATLRIDYFNGSGTNISTTNITISATATGAS